MSLTIKFFYPLENAVIMWYNKKRSTKNIMPQFSGGGQEFCMITVNNYLGDIEISYNYLAGLIRYTVSGCFGVVGLNSEDRLHSFFRFLKNGAYNDDGAAIAVKNDKLCIGLHITVLYGTNFAAVSRNIANKVKFAVEEKTGIKIAKITVFIDGIQS